MNRFQLDPSLGVLPLMPFYTPPEEQGQDRALPQLPPEQPRLNLTKPQMQPPAPYQPPVLDLNAPPGFGQMPATTAPPMAAAEALRGQPPASPKYGGFEWVGASGRRFSMSPDEERGLVEGRQKQMERMRQGLNPLSGVNDNPAGAASGLMGALSEFMDPNVAASLGINVFNAELNRQSAEERAQAAIEARARLKGMGGGSPGAGAPKNTDVNAIFDDVRSDFNVQKGNQSERDLTSILSMLNSPNAFDQRAAIGAKVKEISGAAATDKEREFYLGGAGFWSSLENKINSITAGGQLSPELISQLRQHAIGRLETLRQQRQQAVDGAQTRVDMLSTGDEKSRARLKQQFYDYYMGKGARPSNGGGASSARPGGAPTRGGDDDAETDDLLKKL